MLASLETAAHETGQYCPRAHLYECVDATVGHLRYKIDEAYRTSDLLGEALATGWSLIFVERG